MLAIVTSNIMNQTNSFQHHFLIANPFLVDPKFSKTLIYIYEHNDEGAMGIIINKPMQVTVGDVLRHLNIPITDNQVDQLPVLLGGPVAQEQGFIIVPRQAVQITDKPILANEEIVISTSKLLLQAMAKGEAPSDIMISLGYASWAAGQLEDEIANNAWLLAPYNKAVLFQIPFKERWQAAASSIGVDLNKLISGGNA